MIMTAYLLMHLCLFYKLIISIFSILYIEIINNWGKEECYRKGIGNYYLCSVRKLIKALHSGEAVRFLS